MMQTTHIRRMLVKAAEVADQVRGIAERMETGPDVTDAEAREAVLLCEQAANLCGHAGQELEAERLQHFHGIAQT